jgi:hypothetical protein
MSSELLTTSVTPRDIMARLRQTNLWPGREVNRLFGELVAISQRYPEVPSDMSEDEITELHRICSDGESRLEEYWANRIASKPDELEAFPYLDNYLDMSHAEYADITRILGREPGHVAFVGSGPLPLTALALGGIDRSLRVDCIDADKEALLASQRVMAALGCSSEQYGLIHTDAADMDYRAYDAVIVAALVGLEPSKKSAVLRNVAASIRSDAKVAARSVPDDGRKLLYPRITQLPGELEFIEESTPPKGVINNLVIARRADAGR